MFGAARILASLGTISVEAWPTALLPWVLAWWPLQRLGRALGQA